MTGSAWCSPYGFAWSDPRPAGFGNNTVDNSSGRLGRGRLILPCGVGTFAAGASTGSIKSHREAQDDWNDRAWQRLRPRWSCDKKSGNRHNSSGVKSSGSAPMASRGFRATEAATVAGKGTVAGRRSPLAALEKHGESTGLAKGPGRFEKCHVGLRPGHPSL